MNTIVPAEPIDTEAVIPARYPELARLAWNRDPWASIHGSHALSLYEANWRHVDVQRLTPQEQRLVTALAERYGRGLLLVQK